MGYTDTILDVKSQRVKALLGLAGDSGERPGDQRQEPMVNGTEASSLKDSSNTMMGSVHMTVKTHHVSYVSVSVRDMSGEVMLCNVMNEPQEMSCSCEALFSLSVFHTRVDFCSQ